LPRHIAVVAGDGAGKEVVPEAVKVLRAIGADLDFEDFEIGADRYLATGISLDDATFEDLKAADAILFGAVGDPRVDEHYAAGVLLRIRFEMDLWANLRPARLYDHRLSPLRDEKLREVDLLVVRENTEGVYVGAGGRFKKGTPDEVAIQEDINTYKGVKPDPRACFQPRPPRGLHGRQVERHGPRGRSLAVPLEGACSPPPRPRDPPPLL